MDDRVHPQARVGPAVVCLLLLTAACGSSRASGVTADPNRFLASQSLLPGTTSIITVGTFQITHDVVLEGARPFAADGLQVAAARVNLIANRTHPGINGYPGMLCRDGWPLRGFGPTSTADGVSLK